MITAMLILLALLVLVGFVALCYACATCWLTYLCAMCNNSFGLLAELFVAILAAIADSNR